MEIRQLEMLVAVVEKKGYIHAGEHLHMSHSAVHRQIRLLEEELGYKLFTRTGRTVQLTEDGRLLAGLAARIKGEITAVEQKIKDKQILASGLLRIGTGTTSLTFFLPPVLEEFRRRYPGIEMYILTGTAEYLVHEIQDDNLDVGLISEPMDMCNAEKTLRYERLYGEEFKLVVSKGHPLAKRGKIKWSDLKDVPIISFPSTSRIRHLIDALFREANVVSKVTMELENEEAIEAMIRTGFGAGFIAKRRIDRCGLHGIIVGNEPIMLNVATVCRDTYVSNRVREFLRICHRFSRNLLK